MTMKGFTLIETLVAVTVLTLAVAGPFNALRGALVNSYIARDQLVATSLAQEGIEYIRSVRDANYLGGSSWLTGLGSCTPGPCVVDTAFGTISGTVQPLRLSTGGLYSYVSSSGDKVSVYTRTVSITALAGGTEAKVTSSVSWITRGVTYTTTLTENIRDWL